MIDLLTVTKQWLWSTDRDETVIMIYWPWRNSDDELLTVTKQWWWVTDRDEAVMT